MFTWICPQCGGEVLPSQDECPRCVKKTAPAPPAPPVEEVPAPVPVAAPVPVPVAAAVPVAAPAPAPVAAPAPAPQPAPVYTPPQTAYSAPSTSYDAPPEPRSTGLRDALVTVAVAAVLLGGGYFLYTRGERAERAHASKKTELENVTSAKSTHPLARQIEVTGVRLRVPKQGNAEIQMVVVNHSAAEISGLNMDVVLGAKGTDKEVAAFSVTVKHLSPFGTAEVTAKTKTEVSALDIPDWQFLEPKVVIQAADR